MKKNFGTMAVFLDEQNNFSDFSSMRFIQTYTLNSLHDKWEATDKLPFSPDFNLSPSEIRRQLKLTAEDLKPCRVIITRDIKGLAYQVFDQSGFIICESDEFDLSLLSYIRSDLLEKQKEDLVSELESPTAPIPTDIPGHFFIDLDKLQKDRPDISSKKALLPFFEQKDFEVLDVLCEHFPPWFTDRLPKMNLTFTVIEDKNKLTHVVIEKKRSKQ